jgi:hypothetical protein
MSNIGRKDRAYPRTTKKEIAPIYVFAEQVCADGKGGGGNYVPIGSVMEIVKYDVSKFNVFNRKLILRNNNFDVYKNLGETSPGSGEYIAGDRVDWWLAFSATPNLTAEEIVLQNSRITTPAPFDLDVDYKKLPQPTDAGWDNKIYMYMYWGDTTLVINTRSEADLEVIKHDYDEKI